MCFMPACICSGCTHQHTSITSLAVILAPCHAQLSSKQLCLMRRGKSMVKQHQLVNKILADDIATWHGLTLDLKAPA